MGIQQKFSSERKPLAGHFHLGFQTKLPLKLLIKDLPLPLQLAGELLSTDAEGSAEGPCLKYLVHREGKVGSHLEEDDRGEKR